MLGGPAHFNDAKPCTCVFYAKRGCLSKLFGASIEILLEKLQISKRLIGTWFGGDPPVEFRHCLGNFAFIAEHGRQLKQT